GHAGGPALRAEVQALAIRAEARPRDLAVALLTGQADHAFDARVGSQHDDLHVATVLGDEQRAGPHVEPEVVDTAEDAGLTGLVAQRHLAAGQVVLPDAVVTLGREPDDVAVGRDALTAGEADGVGHLVAARRVEHRRVRLRHLAP